MSRDIEAVRRVIEAFEKSDWTEIDVRAGGVRVHLSAEASAAAGAASPAGRRVPAGRPQRTTTDGSVRTEPTASPPAGAHVVHAPCPGIFWRSPQPGAPPFADFGQHVDAGTTMCIVEVMKLMNHVKAGVAGTVVAVLVQDGTPVAKDAPLFAVAVDDVP